MRIRWCDYCGTTKDVIHTIDAQDRSDYVSIWL